MNRAHRRAIAKGKPPVRLKPKPNPASSFAAIGRSMPLTEDEALKISNATHVAWVKLVEGNAEIVDFDNIAQALNLARVIADGLGEPAITVVREAQDAMKGVRERYLRIERFGVDAATLRDVPPALDFHDEILRTHSPNQLLKALEASGAVLARYRAPPTAPPHLQALTNEGFFFPKGDCQCPLKP